MGLRHTRNQGNRGPGCQKHRHESAAQELRVPTLQVISRPAKGMAAKHIVQSARRVPLVNVSIRQCHVPLFPAGSR